MHILLINWTNHNKPRTAKWHNINIFYRHDNSKISKIYIVYIIWKITFFRTNHDISFSSSVIFWIEKSKKTFDLDRASRLHNITVQTILFIVFLINAINFQIQNVEKVFSILERYCDHKRRHCKQYNYRYRTSFLKLCNTNIS